MITYISGALVAHRLVGRRGLDRTIALGLTCLAIGGLAMLILVLAGLPWLISITLPMSLYTAGVGLVLPSSQASAMNPFPDRAGAASSLLGMFQMSFAALIGVVLGHTLGQHAWPLAAAIATAGLAAFALFFLTRRVRAG